MNNEQNSLLATGQSVSRNLETITATDLPPAFTGARVALKNDLARIAILANAQAQPRTGLTRHRDRVFDAGAEATLIIAALLRGYAKRRGLVDLTAKVDLYPHEFRRNRFSRRAQLMQQVHEAAASVAPEDLAALGVTEVLLADLKTKADEAEALKDLPRDAIAARRVITAQLRQLFAELRSRLRDELDPQMAARRTLDPVAYERYQAARIVIDRSGASAETDDSAPATAPETHADTVPATKTGA